MTADARQHSPLDHDDADRGGPEVSLVIPVYRSRQTLEPLTERIRATMTAAGRAYEIVFVDDASPDDAWSVLQRLQAGNPQRITAVRLMRNFGQHNAIMCGLRHVRGRYVVTLDDDLQNPPEEIPRLLAALIERGDDLVYGVPRRKQHAAGRRLGSWVVNVFFRLVFRTAVTVSAFRAMRRELTEAVQSYDLNFTYLDGLLSWNTQRLSQLEVEHQPRAEGRSGYSLGKLLVLALNLFTNFSLLPLQVASAVGVSAAAGGLAVGLYYVAAALRHDIAVPGYASTIVAILVLGGLQLLAMGLIGEYVGRMHLNVNRKPQYSVREVMRGGEPRLPPADGRD